MVQFRPFLRTLSLYSIAVGVGLLAACAAVPTSPTPVLPPIPSLTPAPTPLTTPTPSPASTTPPTPTPEALDLSSLAPGDYLGFTEDDPSSPSPPEMYLLSLGDLEVIPFLPSAWHASFSPDRTKIAYIDPDGALHILDAASHTELAFNDRCFSTTWSPDSASILCDGENQIVMFPATGGDVLPLAQCGPNPEDMNDCSHSLWSPDGYYIASWRMSAKGGSIANLRYDLFILHPKCDPGWQSCQTSVYGPYATDSEVTDYCDWLFDSRRLLCNNGGQRGLSVLNVPSGERRVLAGNPCTDYSDIAASPHSERVACDLAGVDRHTSIGIGIVSLDDQEPILVLPGANLAVDFWIRIP